MFRLWRRDQPSDNSNMAYSGYEDDLSEDERQILERGGAVICSSHHRPSPSAISSATSSAASVATSGGSTTALIRQKRPRPRAQPRIYRNSPGDQRELNLLLAQPQLPFIAPTKDKMTAEEKTEPQLSPAGVTVADLPRAKNINYIPQVLAAISVSLGSMIVGFVSSYTSPAIPSMKLDHRLGISISDASWIGSLLPLFAIFGGMSGGPAIDILGRRTTILLTAIPFLISFLLIVLAVNVYMIFVARCIAGFCTGIITLALPVYLGETLQSEVRGVLGLLPTTVGNLGILVCFVSGKYLDWSQLAMVGAIIPIPFIISMFLIPETPRWYVSKDKKKSARKALQWLRGKETDVSQEFSEIEKNHQESQLEETSGIGELFSRRYIKPLLISMGLMLFQQMSGINAVMFYTVDIFEASKSSIDKNLCTIMIGLVNLGTVFVSSALIDRLGRKILLYVSSLLMTVTITSLGIYFYFREYRSEINIDHLAWVPLVSFIIYVIGFSIGFGPIPWLMMGEILPARIRGSGASIATSFNWFTTFVITKTFTGSYSIPFLTYGACCFVSLFFVMFFVPETQGKSLEDIERNLTGDGPKIPVRTARRMSSIANLKPTPIAV